MNVSLSIRIFNSALKFSKVGDGRIFPKFPPKRGLSVSRPDRFKMAVSDEVHRSIVSTVREAMIARNKGSSMAADASIRGLCKLYVQMNPDEKKDMLHILARDFSVDHENVEVLARALLLNQEQGDVFVLKGEEKLRNALTPPYVWIFTQIGRLEGGVKFLVDLRTDILDYLAKLEKDESVLAHHIRAMNVSLKDLLGVWFSVGFLSLERITWQSSSDMLQKVSECEAVHPMRHWTDLKTRVGPYRRCFIFTHNSMPKEPIVVLHTFLTDTISNTIRAIVSLPRKHSDVDFRVGAEQVEDPKKITTAIFYSVTSTQKGLHGIELGNYLIKSVVKSLTDEFPKMQQFSSLSPIPGYTPWLLKELTKVEREEEPPTILFSNEELDSLVPLIAKGVYEEPNQIEEPSAYDPAVWSRLKKTLTSGSWIRNENLADELEKPLMRNCAHYLYREKRRGYAFDSVAHFHLRNGAMLYRVNWRADQTPKGLQQSCGIMVNYRYYLEQNERNTSRYLDEQYIAVSDLVTPWL